MNTRIFQWRTAPQAAPLGGLLVTVAIVLCLAAIAAPEARAVPFHTPIMDGTGVVTADGTDWDPADRIVDDSADDNRPTVRLSNVRRLWMTWDENKLYLAMTYQDFTADDAFTLYLDLDSHVGPTNAALLDSLPANVRLPNGHHVDFVIGRVPGQIYGGSKPRVFRVTDDTGSVTPVSSQVVVDQYNNDTTAADPAAKWPVWNTAEIAIPWTVLYPNLAGKVPEYAVIKALAFVGHADPLRNGIDPAPNNPSFDNSTAVAAVTAMQASVIEFNGDGFVDPLAGSIAGTATLLHDDAAKTVTATAELLEFAGRAPGSTLSTVTTTAGVRDWTLRRLPPGRYRVTLSADGWFAEADTVEVAAGQAVTGVNQTLNRKTLIRGVVRFASRDGRAGLLELRDAGGDSLAARAFSPTDSTFEFGVAEGGNYTLHAEARTYLPSDLPIVVVAGTDYTGAVVRLLSQTRIAGHIGFAELVNGLGKPGTVWFRDGEGRQLDIGGFPYNGGDYEFFTPVSGTFSLYAQTLPPIYVEVDTTFAVTAGQDVTGLDFALILKTRVDMSIALDGPNAAGLATLWDSRGVSRDTLHFDSTGDARTHYLEPGTFRLDLAATGYVPRSVPFTVTSEDTTLGALGLAAVRATHLEIVDDSGTMLRETRTTFWDQARGFPFTSGKVTLAARDDAGLDDLYDLGNQLSEFHLSARKMDDLSPPRGSRVFYNSASQADVDSIVSFTDGRATFWMSDTAVEVLRVYLKQPAKDPIAGRLIVAFENPQLKTVVLSATRAIMVASDVDTLRIEAQLYDSANERARRPDVPVAFSFVTGQTGVGRFESATVLTNGDGHATAVLTATGAGPLRATATVIDRNQALAVRGGSLGGTVGYLPLKVIPGPTAGWRLSLASGISGLHDPVAVTALPIDAWDNDTRDDGLVASFTADPGARGGFQPATATTDTFGRATTNFQPSGLAGLVALGVSGEGLEPATASLQVRDVSVIPDPAWRDEPAGHATFDKTDLTALVVGNDPTGLNLEIPFASDWGGLQLHVIFETGFNAAGAASDPFEQPVSYSHANKPDFALTMKYSGMDWGDFRRWAGTKWEWLNPADGTYSDTGYSILAPWVRKMADRVLIRVPFNAFGTTVPDSLRMELYLTQDDSGAKRAAFDSAPQDSTLNLTFDYTNPGPKDWAATENRTYLSKWGPTYVVKKDFPTPPTLTDATSSSLTPLAGEPITVSLKVSDAGDGVGDVLADLSAMGGSDALRLYDDGQSGHGDATAGDGTFGNVVLVPLGNPGGSQDLIFRAWDAGNVLAKADTLSLDVTAIVDPIIQISDPTGDDHGPNQVGSQRKYVTYPTNIVFVPGAFDLTGLTVYETVATVGGVTVPMIAFQVAIRDLPNPADPGMADWNPLYGELNIEKIDILIDNGPGGATTSLPNRGAAFQRWDAWDYAVIMDGWYKALIPSFSQNTLDSWRANAIRTDKDILIVGDPDANTVTAFVSKAALGDPTPEAIRSWDIAVCMSSHDSGGEEVLGGIRWINEARSEWNLGGGANTDRDANLIDLLLVPGIGHAPGKTQEEILDYESADAQQRLTDRLTPVAIEMSAFEDTGPPVIDTGGKGSVVTRVEPLTDAPLALAFRITDDDRVSSATFRYRSTNFAGAGWDQEVAMGYLGNDIWVVDILPTYLETLAVSPIEGTRYLEFEIEADDPYALNEPTVSPVTTLEITPTASFRKVSNTLAGPNVNLLQVDGSQVTLSEALRAQLVARHMALAWTGGAATVDTMGAHIAIDWNIGTTPAGITTDPTVPAGVPLGVFRDFGLATSDSLGGSLAYDGELPSTMELSLHYPQAWLPAGVDEQHVALYQYNAAARRWLLIGGNVTSTGNNVKATVKRAGSYGLFVTDAVAVNGGEALSGITVSPNPFSPNGDGLYDETNISFYLSGEATVTVEIYNISGARQAILTETFPYSGADLNDPTPRRVPGLIWDGRNGRGDYVPYGVYILRVIATYNQAGGTRTIRSNHSVAVIR